LSSRAFFASFPQSLPQPFDASAAITNTRQEVARRAVPKRRIRWRRSLGPSEGCVGDRVSCIQWCARGALEAEARLQIRHPSEEQSGCAIECQD
jgi:hypothetical protein